MGKKETWFQRNSRAVAFFTGLALILIAAAIYVFAPTKQGTDASGNGFVLPFIIVLAIIGTLIMPSPLHALAKAYFKSREKKAPTSPPAGGNA